MAGLRSGFVTNSGSTPNPNIASSSGTANTTPPAQPATTTPQAQPATTTPPSTGAPTFSELHEAAKSSATTAHALLERAKTTKVEEPRETRGRRRLINKQCNLQLSTNVVAEGRKKKSESQRKHASSTPSKAQRKDNTQVPAQHAEADPEAPDFPFPLK
ncbi:uncharacterized protein LOC113332807 [Papaver somniferum]|uniref:uncharacterized protein LOC113332807 n=1 Tax=Papaver somniferum TaxID=3469 RepID=UPI000E6F8CC9|nr:uncharacterized protein LOC113332807 [Papaver somniferum]